MQKWAHSGVGKLGVITHQPLNLGQCSPQTPGGLQLVLVGSLGVPTDCGEAGCGIVGTPDPEGSLQDPSPLGLDTPGEIPPRHPHFSYTEAQQATDSVQQIQTLPPEKLRHHTSHGPVRRRWPRTPRAWDTGPPRWLAMEGRPLSQGWPGQGRPFPAGLGTTASLEGGAGTPAQGCRLHTRDRVGPITRSDPQTERPRDPRRRWRGRKGRKSVTSQPGREREKRRERERHGERERDRDCESARAGVRQGGLQKEQRKQYSPGEEADRAEAGAPAHRLCAREQVPFLDFATFSR